MIELTPITGWLAEVAIAVLVAVLLPVVKRLFDKLGVSKDNDLRDVFDEAVHKAIEYAVERAATRIPDTVETRNAIVNDAATWVISRFPDIVDYFNLSPDQIADSVRARLGEHLDE